MHMKKKLEFFLYKTSQCSSRRHFSWHTVLYLQTISLQIRLFSRRFRTTYITNNRGNPPSFLWLAKRQHPFALSSRLSFWVLVDPHAAPYSVLLRGLGNVTTIVSSNVQVVLWEAAEAPLPQSRSHKPVSFLLWPQVPQTPSHLYTRRADGWSETKRNLLQMINRPFSRRIYTKC